MNSVTRTWKFLCSIIITSMVLVAGNGPRTVATPPVSASLSYDRSSFHERGKNDGGIDNSVPISITLSGDTFDSMTGTDLVSVGLATVTNLPAGLTAVITVTSTTQLTMTITGTATSHTAANDVSDLTVTFNSGTFSTMSPASVTNSTKSDLSISFFDPFTPNALKFDGIDDQMAIFTGAHTAYTIECWVKLSSTANQVVFQRTDGYGVSSSFSHELDVQDGKFQHYLYDGGSWSQTGTTSVSAGVWYHVAITAQNNGAMKLYVNGEQEGDTYSIGTLWTGGDRYILGPTRSGMNYFSGTLDEFRLWDVARSQSAIQSTMNNPLTGTESGLVAYFNFDQGSGTSLYDVSNGGHNASLSNFDMSGTGSNYVSSVTALPVELSSFTALRSGKAVTLRWSTATEVNNSGFSVEKNVEGKSEKEKGKRASWHEIGFMAGHGTTNAPQSYSFVDISAYGTARYRLKQVDHDGAVHYSSEVEAASPSVPADLFLGQNYPNPFNPSTTIAFTVPVTGHASLKVYDAVGREVAVLMNEVVEGGVMHLRTFNASRLSSGTYYSVLKAGERTIVKSMTLVK